MNKLAILVWLPSPCRRRLLFNRHPITTAPYLSQAANCCATDHLCLPACHAQIFSFGRCIPSPRCNIFFRPAHPFAAPPSILLAGTSHRNATIFSFGRCIPLPRHHLFFRPFNQSITLQRCNVFFWRVRSITMWPLLFFDRRIAAFRLVLPCCPIVFLAGV